MGNIIITNDTTKAIKLRFESDVEPKKRYTQPYELEMELKERGAAAVEQQRMTALQNPSGLLLSPDEVAIFDDSTDAYTEMVAHKSVLEDRHGLTVEINP